MCVDNDGPGACRLQDDPVNSRFQLIYNFNNGMSGDDVLLDNFALPILHKAS